MTNSNPQGATPTTDLEAIAARWKEKGWDIHPNALKEIQRLITSEINQARIDELKKARSVDSQLSSADIVNHLEARLAELEAK